MGNMDKCQMCGWKMWWWRVKQIDDAIDSFRNDGASIWQALNVWYHAESFKYFGLWSVPVIWVVGCNLDACRKRSNHDQFGRRWSSTKKLGEKSFGDNHWVYWISYTTQISDFLALTLSTSALSIWVKPLRCRQQEQ